MDAFGKITEIIVTVILLFIVPLNYMAAKQDMIAQTQAGAQTAYFADSVRNLGYLTKNMYELYLRKIEETNHIYDVELTHYKKSADLIETAESGQYQYHYYGTYTDEIVKCLYNTDENEEYHLKQGDYFTVQIKSKDKTFFTKLTELLLNRTFHNQGIYAIYGGAIRDEIN